MSTNYIDEYLVKLGATVDASGMQRFHQALREASAVADASAASIAGTFFKAQTEIVSGFAAIGSAAIGLVDKVAMADQSYRLFALHMYMSKDAARSLKVAMDALGEPLENLTWDKELRARTHQLIEDQRAMAPDGNFDAQMRKVRDIRFEFTRMEVEGEYLAMHVVNDFMKALGLGPDELLSKLRGFNNWVTHDLPQISAKVVSLFMPVWKDVVKVFDATEAAAAATGLAFTNLVGLLTGDDAIVGTMFDLQKFAGAFVHIVDGFASFATAVDNVIELLAHLVNALILVGTGNFSGAASELGAAFHDVTAKAVGAVVGGVAGGVAGSFVGPWGTAAGTLGGSAVGSVVADKLFGESSTRSGVRSLTGDEDLRRSVQKYASQYGVDPRLANALLTQESGMRQVNPDGTIVTSRTGAMGIAQLTRATAKSLGVDRTNGDDNVRGGMMLLGHLLKQYNGDAPTAIAAYHEGETKMNAVLAGRDTLSPEARSEVARVLRGVGAQGNVQVGSIVINIDKPNAVNKDVANVLVARLESTRDKRVQRNLAEFQGQSWSY